MSLLLTREVPLMNWTLLCQLIVLYFVFSVLGWMMEVTLKYIQYHRFISAPTAPFTAAAWCW